MQHFAEMVRVVAAEDSHGPWVHPVFPLSPLSQSLSFLLPHSRFAFLNCCHLLLLWTSCLRPVFDDDLIYSRSSNYLIYTPFNTVPLLSYSPNYNPTIHRNDKLQINLSRCSDYRSACRHRPCHSQHGSAEGQSAKWRTRPITSLIRVQSTGSSVLQAIGNLYRRALLPRFGRHSMQSGSTRVLRLEQLLWPNTIFQWLRPDLHK